MLYKFKATLAEILELTEPLSVSTMDQADWIAAVNKAIVVTATDYADPIVKGFINNYFIPHFFQAEICIWNIEDEEDFDMYMWKLTHRFNITKDHYKSLITDVAAVKALLSANGYGSDVASNSTSDQTTASDGLVKRNDTPLASTNPDLATDDYLSGSERQEGSSEVGVINAGTTTDYNRLWTALDNIPGVRNMYMEWIAEFEKIFRPAM